MHVRGKKLTQHFPDYGLLYYKSHQKFPLNFRISLSLLGEKGLLLFLHFSSIAVAKNWDLSGRGLEATQWLWEFLSRGVTRAMASGGPHPAWVFSALHHHSFALGASCRMRSACQLCSSRAMALAAAEPSAVLCRCHESPLKCWEKKKTTVQQNTTNSVKNVLQMW